MEYWSRRSAILGGLGVVGGCGGGASGLESDAGSGGFRNTSSNGSLLTIPVRLNEGRTHAFAIDSAANISVIAADLARELGLPDDGEVGMNTLVARESVRTVRVGRLQTGALDMRDARLALGSREALGTDGLIGTELLANLRLDLRFRGMRRLRVTHSRSRHVGFFEVDRAQARIVKVVQQRFGQLCAIQAHVGQTPIVAILDTGAQVSIGNTALARVTRAAPRRLDDGRNVGEVQSPTGRTAHAAPVLLRALRFAGVSVGQTPLLVGDFHIFKIWNLIDTPAMLIGVDLLGLFESVAIDLRRQEVTFQA